MSEEMPDLVTFHEQTESIRIPTEVSPAQVRDGFQAQALVWKHMQLMRRQEIRRLENISKRLREREMRRQEIRRLVNISKQLRERGRGVMSELGFINEATTEAELATRIRKHLGISRREMGNRVGFVYSYVANVEAGSRPLSKNMVIAYAKAIQIDPKMLAQIVFDIRWGGDYART
jgi:hypothetical protein